MVPLDPMNLGLTMRTIVYRHIHGDQLVFAFEDEARRVSEIRTAIKTAKTWGEFKKLMPHKDYSEIIQAIDDLEKMPTGLDTFSADQVPGYHDGDYPTWLQAEMEHVLPAEILEKYAYQELSVFNGEFWSISSNRLSEILADLEVIGISTREENDLNFY